MAVFFLGTVNRFPKETGDCPHLLKKGSARDGNKLKKASGLTCEMEMFMRNGLGGRLFLGDCHPVSEGNR